MVNALTTPVMIAIVIIIAVVGYLMYARKTPKIRKQAAGTSKVVNFFNYLPLILLVILASVILIQSFGYILSQYFGFNWVALGFIIKGLAVALLVYFVFSVMTQKFAIDSPQRLVVLIIILAILVFILIGLEKVVPQLFSTKVIPFSASQLLG